MGKTLQKKAVRYVMILASCGNPDFGQNPSAMMSDPSGVKADTLKALVHAAEDYRDQNELGGGNWIEPEIRENGKPIARISYNGRVWALDGSEIRIA